MTTEELQRARRFAEKLVVRGGTSALKAMDTVKVVDETHGADVTTDADKAIEQEMRRRIVKEYPAHAICGEEGGGELRDEPTWFLDPIDGTAAYARHFPLFCSVAALQIGMDVVVGAVYNPMTKELFSAAKGLGASCNGSPINVAATATLDHATIVATNPRLDNLDRFQRTTALWEKLFRSSFRVRDFGNHNLSLSWVAKGSVDALVHTVGLKKGWWDCAAGICIALEAGAEVVDFNGQPFTVAHAKEPFIAASPVIADQLLVLVDNKN